MVQVWFMDDDVEGDQRLEHKRSPPTYMELKELYNKTGVEYFKVMRPSWKSSLSLKVSLFLPHTDQC